MYLSIFSLVQDSKTQSEPDAQVLPPAPVAQVNSGDHAIIESQLYKLSDSDRDLVLNAASSLDVPVNIRNKLYAALNRSLQKTWIPPEVLARWADDQENSVSKFVFLKEWCKDTSFASMHIEERHIKKTEEFRHMKVEWSTKLDLDLKYRSDTNASGQQYVEKILRGPSRPHPFFPRDKTMRLFKHLAELGEGRIDTNAHERMSIIKGEVEGSADVAKALEHSAGKSVVDQADFGFFDDKPAAADKPAKKGNGAAKSEPAEPAGVKKDLAKVPKLSALLNKINAKEVEMNTLRNQLSNVKPNLKNMLDTHLQVLEDFKIKLEPAVLAGEENVELANEANLLLTNKSLKSDVAMAAKTVKAG